MQDKREQLRVLKAQRNQLEQLVATMQEHIKALNQELRGEEKACYPTCGIDPENGMLRHALMCRSCKHSAEEYCFSCFRGGVYAHAQVH